MKYLSQLSTTSMILISMLGLGCEQAVVIPAKAPVAAFAVPESAMQATNLLVGEASAFDADVARLPGGSADEHREILVALLDRLPKMLKLANGSVESREFQTRIAVIMAAKETVSDPEVDRRRMEAVENQALQAAGPALAEINRRVLFDDDQLPPLLQILDDKVSAAAGPVGPMHDLDAANAFTALAAVTDRVTASMQERFGGR